MPGPNTRIDHLADGGEPSRAIARGQVSVFMRIDRPEGSGGPDQMHRK